MEEEVFRALADPNRRLLLDRLFEHDGQTLTELEQHLPAMTRFGVMKHLRVLEAAGVVVTRRAGREKFHYLNPVPIQLIYQRWVSKYAEPFVRALGGLKAELEGTTMTGPRHVFEVYIRATPDRIWDAITNGELTKQYYYGTAVESEWAPGLTFAYRRDGADAVTGNVLEIDPPRRLTTTFRSHWNQEFASEAPSRVTWEITPMGDACKLTLVHDGFPDDTRVSQAVAGGWPLILSSLKTLLETGEPLVVDDDE